MPKLWPFFSFSFTRRLARPAVLPLPSPAVQLLPLHQPATQLQHHLHHLAVLPD